MSISAARGGRGRRDWRRRNWRSRFRRVDRSRVPELEAEPTSCDAPAFWLYSSGSTGRPKGCVHLQHDMAVCAESYARGVLGIDATDRCFSVAKLFFAYGLGNAMYFPLAVGATSILWPGPVTPPLVYDVIERYRPTLFFSVPTHYAMLLAHRDETREFDLSSIRCAVSAGESLPPAVFTRFRERFGVEILDGIGSTEVLHIFISNRRGSVRPGSSGVPVSGLRSQARGRAWRAGGTRRHRQPADQRRLDLCLVLEPARADEGDDRGALDSNRRPLLSGRRRVLLVCRPIRRHAEGRRHLGQPRRARAHAARALRRPGVRCRRATGSRRPDQAARLRGLARGRHGHAELAAELQQFARSRLAEYKRPRWVEFVDALPTTATGKVQRFKLRERADRRRRPSPGNLTAPAQSAGFRHEPVADLAASASASTSCARPPPFSAAAATMAPASIRSRGALNMAPGNLYYYFRNKEEILYVCHDYSLGLILKELQGRRAESASRRIGRCTA